MKTVSFRKTGAVAVACFILLSQASTASAKYLIKVPMSKSAAEAPTTAEAGFDRSNHDFALLPMGSSATQELSLFNSGTATLSLGAPNVEGAGFAVESTNCLQTLKPAAGCSVVVGFKPTAFGSQAGRLSIDTGAGGVQSVDLLGTGGASLMRWDSASLDFGPSVANTTYKRSNTLHNRGNMPAAVTIEPPASVTASSCGAIPANDKCVVEFTYTPVGGQTLSNSLVGVKGATTNENSLAISGVGVAVTESASVDKASMLFGNVAKLGAQTLGVQLTNTGNTTLTLPASVATISNNADLSFTSMSTCPTTLAPGASCRVSVDFVPKSIATYTAGLSLNAGAAGAKAVALSGTGTGSIARWAVSTLDFGNQVAMGGTFTKTVDVFNDGNVAGDFSLAALPAGMTASAPGCASVAPASSCTVTFTYTPAEGVTYSSGALRAAAATETANTLTVTGKGVAPTPAYFDFPASINFGDVYTGFDYYQTVTLQVKGDTGSVSMADIYYTPDHVIYVQDDNCAGPLTPGQSCKVELRLNASGAGTGTDLNSGSYLFDVKDASGTVKRHPVPAVSNATLSYTVKNYEASISAGNELNLYLPFLVEKHPSLTKPLDGIYYEKAWNDPKWASIDTSSGTPLLKGSVPSTSGTYVFRISPKLYNYAPTGVVTITVR